MDDEMKIMRADRGDISALFELQLIAFQSEAEIIKSREIPALQETFEESKTDFINWTTLKLINNKDDIFGAVRYKEHKKFVEVGRLMIHPNFRNKGLGKQLLSEVDRRYPDKLKELYTCTKSLTNINLYKKVGYHSHHEVEGENGLSFVYMRKI